MIVEVDEPVRLDREFVQDPHALYRRLRTEAPAHPMVMWGGVRAWGHPLCRSQGAAQRSQAQQGPGTCHGALSAGHRWFARVVAECEHAAEGSAGPHQAATVGQQGLHGAHGGIAAGGN